MPRTILPYVRTVETTGLLTARDSLTSMTEPVLPPVAARRPHERTLHGDTFLDQYEWLRDKTSNEVLAYLNAENAYTEAQTANLADLRADIFHEIKARTQETDLSVPEKMTHTDGTAYWYYTRTVEGQDYAIHCRVKTHDDVPPSLEGEINGEEILLDGNAEAGDHEFFSLGALVVSPDGQRLAWLVDNAGDERFTLRVKDLRTGELLGDHLDNLGYGLAWAGNDWLFYSRVDSAWRPYQTWRHRLGTDASTDSLVFQENDERFWMDCAESRDRKWIVISVASKLTGEVSLLSVDDPEGTPRVVRPRVEGLDYSVEPAGDRLLIVHNENALDYALAEAPLEAPAQWQPVLPHTEGVRLSHVDAYATFAVVSLRRDGLKGAHILPRQPDGSFGTGSDLAFDEPVYNVEVESGPDYHARCFRIAYTSLVTPTTVIDVGVDGTQTVLKQTPVLDDPKHGAYDPAQYVQKREWVTAADGAQIPISLVYRADVALDGSAPCLLYGYGSYETSIDPVFSIPRLTLLERGVIYAIAHVRGGGEMGRAWYDNGKLSSKRNTFTDFVACAEHLCDAGYTSPSVLAAEGRSAGGLLMGAVTNLAPEMFVAIHAGVPFVDALTSMTMPELPLTIGEWEEWGDPVHDPAAYAYMKSYTPYENVRPEQRYPAILATTSLNDTRVLYVEPAKWVAQLRHTLSDSTQVLLQTEMVAGHGGVSGRYGRWQQLAFEYAWLLDKLGASA